MKMFNYRLMFLLSVTLIIAISCSDEIDTIDDIHYNRFHDLSENVVIFERQSDLPIPKTRKKTLFGTRGRELLKGNSDALLGYGYKLFKGSYILGDLSNVSNPILDLEAIKNYDPFYISAHNVNKTETEISVYDNEETLYKDSLSTKIKASGFRLNLKIFSVGKLKYRSSTFYSVMDNTANSIFGEVGLKFINNKFSLQTTNASTRLYARRFLTKSFIRSLYGSTMSSIVDSYGEFVLTDYLTGGKAFATYAGNHTKNATATVRGKDLSKVIYASLAYPKDTTYNGHVAIGFTGNNKDSTFASKKFTDLFMSVQIFGGKNNATEVALRPMKLEDVNINLTSWAASLADENNNTLIDIANKGLTPISDFVLENNFKQRIDDTTNGVLQPFNDFVTPYMVIERVQIRSNFSYNLLYDIVPVLITRQGDRIIFIDDSSYSKADEELSKNEDKDYFLQVVKKLSSDRSKMFSSTIELDYNKKVRLNPDLRNPLCIVIKNFNKNEFYKYSNKSTSIDYIFNPKTHIAFSYFVDEGDDEVLDIYGIRDWVESLPEKKVSMATLANHYNIIGL